MPAMGLGTCCRESSRGDALVASLGFFFAAGGRLVDTASSYKNHRDVAVAVADFARGRGRSADEIWITSKVDTVRDEGGREGVLRSVDKALSELRARRLDLMLLHHPQCRLAPGDAEFADEAACLRSSWEGLVEAQRAGKVRAIGVSNFNVSQLETLLRGSAVVPAVNQLELHPWCTEAADPVLNFCAARGIAVTAFNSLGGATRPAASAWSVDAVARARNVTAPQLLLRWAMDRGVAVVPGATSRAHIQENVATCAVGPLTAEEHTAITAAPKPAGWRSRAILGKVKHST